MEVQDSAYPHLFIRVQIKTPEDLSNTLAVQEKITLSGISKELTIKNPIRFTFPYEPEYVELFWSVTRYSALTRNTLPGKNDIYNAYNTKPDADGNVTITFSVDDPHDGTYWMPVNAAEPYYFVARYYKPDLNHLPEKPCN
jgi:hypothetical protein